MNFASNRKLGWIMFAIVVISLLGSITYGMNNVPTSGSDESVIIEVKSGMSAGEIGKLLHEQGVINNPGMFHLMAKLKGLDNSLKAGEYTFTRNMSISDVIAKLLQGETAYYQITVPEGYTVEQIALLLKQKKVGNEDSFKQTATAVAPFSYMQVTKPGTKYSAEGFLFPDTYRVAKSANEEQLIAMMLDQFDKKFTAEMRQRSQELGLSIREVVTLASLVEKEAKLEQERSIIAGVFLNRLRTNMPLQSCATIQYILGYAKQELTVQDTEIASPYNTYQHTGLPPGPIANPGFASLNAVLYAANVDYLYFVANKDGSHVFSRTYDEHLAAIKQVLN